MFSVLQAVPAESVKLCMAQLTQSSWPILGHNSTLVRAAVFEHLWPNTKPAFVLQCNDVSSSHFTVFVQDTLAARMTATQNSGRNKEAYLLLCGSTNELDEATGRGRAESTRSCAPLGKLDQYGPPAGQVACRALHSGDS